MRTIRSVQGLGFLAVAFALLVAPAASGEVGRVTGVTGSVSTGGREVANLSGVAQDEKIETGDDGNVAMLLGNDVLVELCSRSSAVVEEDEGRRIVRLESGEARIVVEPGRRDVPIEIHTPAAIATILGTVVYVSVDPTTGATTVTSSDHDVQVIGIGPAATAPVKIKGGERTTVSWGSEPAKPQKLGFTSMRNLGSCLGDFDRRLRTISVIRARAAAQSSMVTQNAMQDMLAAEALPPVGSAPASTALVDGSGTASGPSPLDLPFDPTGTIDTFTAVGESAPRVIPSCGGSPGEHCSF